MQSPEKLIHLLYVPTVYCNLGCTYCYLGRQTDQNMLKKDFSRALSTLQLAIQKFTDADITPFNISLHGGEVTTLPGSVLSELFNFIRDYYQQNKDLLLRHDFKKSTTHIKTNLYNFDKHYELMQKHQVSISASLDLPLALHDKYRVTKRGASTLARTLKNVDLLAHYPHRKKMSAVLYDEHLDRVDEIIDDIWRLHTETGFDMNYFNFMFGFESSQNTEKFMGIQNLNTQAVSDTRQVEFYHRLKQAFGNTELAAGFEKNWFDEFTPSYCTNAFNCGEKFFLLQSDGNIYSCVRGQGSDAFHYGNIHQHSIAHIMANAEHKIASVHRFAGMHADCQSCEYLSLCNTGCAYVKHEQNQGKSYTCALQKEIYKDYPELYAPTEPEKIAEELNSYVVEMHPHLVSSSLQSNSDKIILPNDLYDKGNTLQQLIQSDPVLPLLFSPEQVIMLVNGVPAYLQSQLLKTSRVINTVSLQDKLEVIISAEFMHAACDDPVRNTLHLQFLRDTPVVYGDEQRVKQEHTYTLEVFRAQLSETEYHAKPCFHFDLTAWFRNLSSSFQPGVINNLVITTQYLRKYHYQKQQANAFYHIQAINLPFQNFEYYWSGE